MRAFRYAVVVACVVLSAAGCERDRTADTKAPSAARPSVAPPAGLVAVVELPGGDNRLGSLAKVVDLVQPGASAMLGGELQRGLTELAGGSLDGADLSKPIRLVALDPSKHASPLAVLLAETAPGKLAPAGDVAVERGGGYALIGPPEVVRAAADFALGDLLRRPAAIEPSITIFVQPLRAAFADDIARWREQISSMGALMGQSSGELMGMYADMFDRLADQVDRAVLVPSVGDDGAGVRIRLIARPGSGLAQYAGAQRPADLSLLERLPPTENAQVVFVANVDPSPMAQYGEAFMQAMMNVQGQADETRTLMRRAIELADGRLAMVLGGLPLAPVGGMVSGLRGDDAEGTMLSLMKSYAAGGATEIGSIKQRIEVEPGALVYDGVKVWRTTTHFEASDPQTPVPMPSTTAYGAVVDNQYINVFGAEAGVGPAIDAARGKGAGARLDGALARPLQAVVRAGASVALVLDIGAFSGGAGPVPTVSFSIGFAPGEMLVDFRLGTP